MKDFAGKRLLVLGGMKISCEIVKQAHQMGIFVGVTDYNDVKDSPAKQIADAHYLVSTTDIDSVVKLIKDEKYDGVFVGFVDVLLPFYADICKKAGLPCYGTREQFEKLIDKNAYKKICSDYGVPVIPDLDPTSLYEEEKRNNLPYPIILKPADSSGARGITICYSPNDVEKALEKAKKGSLTHTFVAEPYLEGPEATVFWYFQNGKTYLTMIGNRHMRDLASGIIPLPIGYSFPSCLTEGYVTEIVPKAEKMFSDLGLKNGMVFMQCKVCDGKCLVYDIGFRLTGSLEYKILEEACGYNPLELMIEHALTGSAEDVSKKVDPYLNKNVGWNISFLMKPGTISKMEGLEKVREINGVIDAVVAHEVGETITEAQVGLLTQICCRVLGVSGSVSEAKETIDRVTHSFHIEDNNGTNLLYDPINLEECSDQIAVG